MRILLSWSSGKDSAWALHVLNLQYPGAVRALLTTVNEAVDRVAMHAVRRDVLEAQARGVDIPIIPGIMPIVGFTKLARFSDACGAEIPRWMRKKFESFGDDTDSIRAFGLDIVTELCERLLQGGAPGLHFYSMNQSALTTEICRRLSGQ